MSHRPFAELARFEAVGEHRYAGQFEPSYHQGRGTFGGLVAATLGQCLERSHPGRDLRALSVHLCAPAEEGPLEVAVTTERVGTAVSFASVRMEQAGPGTRIPPKPCLFMAATGWLTLSIRPDLSITRPLVAPPIRRC